MHESTTAVALHNRELRLHKRRLGPLQSGLRICRQIDPSSGGISLEIPVVDDSVTNASVCKALVGTLQARTRERLAAAILQEAREADGAERRWWRWTTYTTPRWSHRRWRRA